MELKFYYCEDCDNIVIMLKDSGVRMTCCGQPMIELTPNMSGASLEKHAPVCRVEGSRVTVTVGAAEHPAEPGHFIEWVALETRDTVQRKLLGAGQPPEVSFALCEGDEVKAVYAYCNLHGLWKS